MWDNTRKRLRFFNQEKYFLNFFDCNQLCMNHMLTDLASLPNSLFYMCAYINPYIWIRLHI